jgi:hypothetical protein
LGVKRPGREADNSFLYSAQVKNDGAVPPLHIDLPPQFPLETVFALICVDAATLGVQPEARSLSCVGNVHVITLSGCRLSTIARCHFLLIGNRT